jgi:hypothetical protein
MIDAARLAVNADRLSNVEDVDQLTFELDTSDMKPKFPVIALLAITVVAVTTAATSSAPEKRKPAPPITVRTESYPRPPYSGATYYIYEQSGQTICTKLEVCNKFGDCSAQYFKGTYRAQEDKDTGDAYNQSPAIEIPRAKLNKHVCLRRFKLM